MTEAQYTELLLGLEGVRQQLSVFTMTVEEEFAAMKLRQLKILAEVLPFDAKRR